MGFSESSIFIKIALALLPISVIFLIVGLATNNWASYDQASFSSTIGLWKQCITIGTQTDCQDFGQATDIGFIEATRAFVILGMLAAVAGTVVIVLSILKTEIKALRIVAVTMPYIAGFCGIIGVGIFGGKFSSNAIYSLFTLSWSLALTAVGGALSIVAGILASIDLSKVASN